MNISKEDFIKKYCIEKEGKTIFPFYKYEKFDIETMSYEGLSIVKTAQEMYEESQKQNDNYLEIKNNQELTKEILLSQQAIADLEIRLILNE